MFKNNRLTVLGVVLCLVLISLVATPVARADDWDKKTLVTFGHPVKVPGIVLPAGTYMFEVADLKADRSVVRITNEEGTVVYATVIAIRDFRLAATEDTTLIFNEAPANEARSLRTWFYPGKNYGYEFVYAEGETAAIAPPAVVARGPSNLERELWEIEELAESGALEPAPRVIGDLSKVPSLERELREIERLAVPETEPFNPETAPFVVEPPAEVTVEPLEEELPAELPRTASPVPLLGLIGLIGLAGAFMLRRA
jgi:hypothetical protein